MRSKLNLTGALQDSGTMRFAESLKKKLGMNVQIRKRVLVISKDWQTLSSQSGWGTFEFEKAYEKGLTKRG